MSDLSQKWIQIEIEKQIKAKQALEGSYEIMVNKTTPYARGILKMACIRWQIVELLRGEL